MNIALLMLPLFVVSTCMVSNVPFDTCAEVINCDNGGQVP